MHNVIKAKNVNSVISLGLPNIEFEKVHNPTYGARTRAALIWKKSQKMREDSSDHLQKKKIRTKPVFCLKTFLSNHLFSRAFYILTLVRAHITEFEIEKIEACKEAKHTRKKKTETWTTFNRITFVNLDIHVTGTGREVLRWDTNTPKSPVFCIFVRHYFQPALYFANSNNLYLLKTVCLSDRIPPVHQTPLQKMTFSPYWVVIGRHLIIIYLEHRSLFKKIIAK